ncbi:laminin G [Flavobacterium hydrophilum]|uniref:Laminin G n=2 Tax=Flavobacterium hydrophilum TaxID=2211445 RepID=A0A2V4C3Z9_9FLAO|nr:laminin G [Flavobacterium hydrophilum]
MKKLIITLVLGLMVTGLWAQVGQGARVVNSSQAIQKNGFTIQVGLPFLGQNKNTSTRTIQPVDVRFPWSTLYLYNTFAEESFDVSKGYFGDKILITWDLRSNFELISSIKIYKKEYSEPDSKYVFVGSVAPSVTQYEDKYAEGGVLFQYKVVAEGVSKMESLYTTHITGYGYRNPTAIVTGNISYEGGNPVKDVIVMASTAGNSVNPGSSLDISAAGSVKIENTKTPITNAVTYQAWVKPKKQFTNDSGTPVRLLRLVNLEGTNLDVSANLLAASKKLAVTVGNSVFELQNYFPSGKLNSRGDDLLVPVSEFNNSFVHFSVVINDGKAPLLFINGRPVTVAYKESVNSKLVGVDANYAAPYFNVTVPVQANSLKSSGGNATEWTKVNVGGGNDAYIDEIRIWKAELETTAIRTDYARYISGNDSRLIAYLRANEKVGLYAYDLSRNGFNYNKNHGSFENVAWATGAVNFPTADQLGILGVTDKNGNYEITAIPYSGTGESFTITPMYGNHKFESAQQLVFLGQGSEVVNKVNFIDKSSFSFKGVVQYDTRGVFPSFVDIDTKTASNKGTSWISGPGILDEGYNYYQLSTGEKYAKGQYWMNTAGTPADKSDDYLDRYAAIFTQGANVYIDGNIVLDKNNVPVVTDDKGFFDISVPIGNHYVTVKKEGHVFTYNGRFPANDFKEFFEDSNEPVVFVDNTRVTVAGKVVGGPVEAAKVTGFGDKGLVTKTIKDTNGNTLTAEVSAKNNIGTASFTLGYAPVGANVTPYTKYNFLTNAASGEYRVDVMPLRYDLKAEDLKIPSSTPPLSLLKSGTTEVFDFSKVTVPVTPEFSYTDGTVEKKEIGKPYHYEKSFTYRSTPTLEVTQQTSDTSIDVDGTYMSTAGFANPVYTQFHSYKIVLNRFERYTNNDIAPAVSVTVPVTDGELIKNNNLALANSENVTVNGSNLTYTFKAGLPSITPPFQIKSTLKYRINEVDYDVENYKDTGVILGGKADGSQTFVTAAPDVPAIILRDPPGSNSFATIEKGESVSFTSEASFAHQEGAAEEVKIGAGVFFELQGGLVPTPKVTIETTNSAIVGIGLNNTSEDGNTVTSTYTFNKAISTSDATDYVGADGDLYIGNSKNIFYGSYDNVEVSKTIPKKYVNGVTVQLPQGDYVNLGTAAAPVYISKQKALSFVDKPTETFFMYSQKHILTNLIPEYELFISTSLNGPNPNAAENVQKREEYAEKIRLWRKVILDNEKSKYAAKNDRSGYKGNLANVITGFNDKVSGVYNGTSDPAAKSRLTNQLKESKDIKNLLDANFEKNISFDSGVGEYNQSVETSVVSASTTSYNLVIDESVAAVIGTSVNKVGVEFNTKAFFQQDINSSLAKETTNTTNISYTLKDNDPANFLSVDVVNAFDGNGPVFITQGGRTSCPQEGAELSYFYNHTDYNEAAAKIKIDELAQNKRQPLTFATQKVEVPVLTVTDNDMSNIVEGKNAEFELKLENNSMSGSDANYLLKVDNTTNPNNALINIEQNGTIVFVPYGKTTTYKLTLAKSISDIYEYKDIRIVLQSLCDGEDVSSSVLVSAHFVPSCSPVTVSAPLNNWVHNMETAYNTDGTTNPLLINVSGYNTKFSSFKKIDLEYRLATSPNWIRLQTYYGSQAFYDAAVLNNETQITFIGSSATLPYNFDIAALKLLDGNYEIRARSTCTNNTEYISDVITGRVDLHAPQRFGTPLPIDGILGAGEDLKVSFNEPVFYNSAVSTIEIKGQTNQLPVDHNVSLRFDGTASTSVINSPKITSGDLTFEFWMNNSTTAASAAILAQQEGLSIQLKNGEIYFNIGAVTANGPVTKDNLYHHYTFTHKNSTGEVRIYEDDKEIGVNTGTANMQFSNNNGLVIGGNSFVGNMHDLRLWNKTIGLDEAYAKMYTKLIGNEANLIGYWPMDEGRGTLANDKARYKHAVVKATWDIKPKGTSYEFANGQNVALTNVNFVQLTKEMDATVSFWVKTAVSQEATLFSNGKGDGTDLVQSNGLANKWAINMKTDGNLTLESEGRSYKLTNQNLADGNWHNVTLLFNRLGSLKTYVDAANVSSNQMASIGGFSGSKIWLGARGSVDLANNETIDRPFTGKIDEFQLWNTLRNEEQISRDRYNEVDVASIGLLLYSRLNAPDPANANGPRYYHADVNQTVIADNAVLSNGTVNYSNDTPAIKPERALIKFLVNHIINKDEMILEPIITDWASLEGQVVDVTVHKMYDSANNMQQSPVTWTAYVKRNEVSWFAEGYNEVVDIVKNTGASKSFEITLLNKGGKGQPFTITNIPKWLTLSSKSGTIAPNSKIIITAAIDKELTAGEYLENMYLQTDFGYDEKMQIKMRVLAPDPGWTVNPGDFKYSMNIVGRIKVDGRFSEDSYDKIAAFYNGQVRGAVNLVYNAAYKEYYAFLTVYSNTAFGEEIEFKIWDSSKGEILQGTLNGKLSVTFEENETVGKLSLPAIFENSNLVEQHINFNKGWTWVSFNVNDANFSDLNKLTANLKLETSDRILSYAPALLETYFKDGSRPANSGWSGTISANGGVGNTKMYKVYTAQENPLIITGASVNVSDWSFPIQNNWNWLPYPLAGNQSVNEALAYFDAADGDVIKSQNLFAIYDPLVGWNGTLNYLEAGKGYMIKSSKAQTFKYPGYLANTAKNKTAKITAQEAIPQQFKQYPDNMNAIVLLPEGYKELYAYDANGILKGEAKTQWINGKELSFITVYGDKPETLSFYIGDGITKKKTSKTFSFAGENVLGTFAQPVIIDEAAAGIKVYPNPFDNEITVELYAAEKQQVVLQLVTLTGQLLSAEKRTLTAGTNLLKINPIVASGVYLLKVEINGHTEIYKVIKNQ